MKREGKERAKSRKMILATQMSDCWLPSALEGGGHIYGKGSERVVELPEDWFPVLKNLGFTMLQVDSFHLNTNEMFEGSWDWEAYDRLLKKCRKKGFKTIFFPHWHWPPLWYEQSKDFTGIRCVEHNESIPCFSLWSPRIKGWFDRCTGALREYHDSAGKVVSAIYLGVYGDFGEAMFPIGDEIGKKMLKYYRGIENVHWHSGFWCNDRYARKDFQGYLSKKYGSIPNLNFAWKSKYVSFSQIIKYPSLPDSEKRRPWLDFIQWYYDSMTDFSAAVARITRKYFPRTLLMVPLGGGVEFLQFGQDNTGIPEAMKRYNVHVRSTCSGAAQMSKLLSTPEKFERNYLMLKRSATACKFYNLPFWVEPPYPPKMNSIAIITRIFESISCGAVGYYDWSRNIYENRETYEKYKNYLTVEKPQVDVAIFFSTTYHRLHPSPGGYPERFWQGCSDIRRVTDYDVLDERLMIEGALKRYRILILFEGNVIEESSLKAIREWVESGGVVVSYDQRPVITVEGNASFYDYLFGFTSASRKIIGKTKSVSPKNKLLPHFRKLKDFCPKYSYANLAKDVEPLVVLDRGAVVWKRKMGRGCGIFFAGKWQERLAYYELIRDVVYNLSGLDSGFKDAPDINNCWDEVFTTLCKDKIFFLNLAGRTIKKDISGVTVTLPPFSIQHLNRN